MRDNIYAYETKNYIKCIFICTAFQRFKDNDIEVKRKDGIILLRELAAEVKNFMDFKRNAVMVSVNQLIFFNSCRLCPKINTKPKS